MRTLVPLLRHLLTANENLNVSVLSRGSEDKNPPCITTQTKDAFYLHQHKLPILAVSQRTGTHTRTHIHKGIDERRKKPFLNDTSHYPDFLKLTSLLNFWPRKTMESDDGLRVSLLVSLAAAAMRCHSS